MSSLPSFERMLGSLHLWPRDILRYLFLIPPTHHTIHDMVTFFYGNDIPLHLALEFFQECSSPAPDHVHSFLSHYAAWDHDTKRPYSFDYFDMTDGHVVRVDDRRVTIAENIPIEIGFGDNIFPPLVMRKIDDMRK